MEKQMNLFGEAISDEENNLEDEHIEEENVMDENIESDTSIQESGEEIESEGFSNRPKGLKEHDKIQIDEEFPEKGMILTIESVEAQPLRTTDKPEQSKFGPYYKKKLILNFAEEYNDRKLREFIPSVFYNMSSGKARPSLPRPCSEEDLSDPFTSKLAKVRCLYMKAFNVADDESDADFIQNLVGKRVLVEKSLGKWRDEGITKKYATLDIVKFVV
jgi:hypothetical protein